MFYLSNHIVTTPLLAGATQWDQHRFLVALAIVTLIVVSPNMALLVDIASRYWSCALRVWRLGVGSVSQRVWVSGNKGLGD